MKKSIVVIGGSAAGPKAASKARRMDPNAEITIIQKAENLSMASCGYPYFIGGTFDEEIKLICTPTGVPRDPQFFFNVKDINAIVSTEVTSIDPQEKKITAKHTKTGEVMEKKYDQLVICTGSKPIVPGIPGIDLNGVTTLHTMEDAKFLKDIAKNRKSKHAVIIGGGLIGIEVAEALTLAGIKITVVERQDQILSFLDLEMAKLVEKHLKAKGGNIYTGASVEKITGKNGQVAGVELSDSTKIKCDLVVSSIGVRPNSDLAADAGLEIGETGGIAVNEYMQTSDESIYAAGDCVEVKSLVTGKKMLWPMGDAANLQGRVIGQNLALGNKVEYKGVVSTGICKVFDFVAGSTGISEGQAERDGIEVVSTIHAAPDRPGFMGALPIVMKMIAEKNTGKIIGVQAVGMGDVSKRIAEAAVALHAGMTVDDLLTLDLPYAPPFSAAIDNFITCAHVLDNKIKGYMKGINPKEVKAKFDSGEDFCFLDVRGPDELEEMRFGKGELNLPLGALRANTDKLPEDKNAEIIAFCKISLRGYEAQLYLESIGYTNVKVLEGGIVAWPYDREK
ncbi:MAG: pyridine nucleotide-disulfide oxidoreductase [Gammaproteobacteria bacterium]|nr:MAG: pyridine nucleotide-disulfide oxidoreductase [Gammaproteobacteria bacterium]